MELVLAMAYLDPREDGLVLCIGSLKTRTRQSRILICIDALTRPVFRVSLLHKRKQCGFRHFVHWIEDCLEDPTEATSFPA